MVYGILAGRSGCAKLDSPIVPLWSRAQDSDHAPTRGMLERRDGLLAELASQQRALTGLRAGERAAFAAAVESAGLPRVIVPGG